MPKSPTSDYITSYAAEKGVPRRTAQDRFKKRHPDVMDWLVRAGIRLHDEKRVPAPIEARALVDRLHPVGSSPFALGLKGEGCPEPAELKIPVAERTMEEHAVCELWLMFVGATAATRDAAKTNDISAAGFARTAVECLKSLQSAQAALVRSRIESKRLLPIAEYDALCADARRVTEAWKSMVPDLSARIDPTNPTRLNRLFEDWIQDRINPLIESFLSGPSALAA